MPLPTETRSLTDLPPITLPALDDLLLVHDSSVPSTKSATFAQVRGVRFSLSAPTAANDETEGVIAGSAWVQTNAESPLTILWVCTSAAAGAAVWTQIPQPASGAPTAIGRTGAVGGSATIFAREDHAHDVSLVTRALSASGAVASTDEILVVDTSAGNVVLTLPAPTTKRYYAVKKRSVDTNKITLRPHDVSGSGPQIEGAAAGADFDLPNSALPQRGYWFFFSDSAAWWIA